MSQPVRFSCGFRAMPALCGDKCGIVPICRTTGQKKLRCIVRKKGLMQGYNGNFRPTDHLSRAEMAAVIVRSLGLTEETDLTAYSDIDVFLVLQRHV